MSILDIFILDMVLDIIKVIFFLISNSDFDKCVIIFGAGNSSWSTHADD